MLHTSYQSFVESNNNNWIEPIPGKKYELQQATPFVNSRDTHIVAPTYSIVTYKGYRMDTDHEFVLPNGNTYILREPVKTNSSPQHETSYHGLISSNFFKEIE
jgi:hypothetical protein